MRRSFKLEFDNAVVNHSDISRILNFMITEDNPALSYTYLATCLEDIHNTELSLECSEDVALKRMLGMLAVTNNKHAYYCFYCCKYVISKNEETVCAYHNSSNDQHRVWHIGIEEVDTRVFVAIWGEGYTKTIDKPMTDVVDFKYFEEERGYDEDTIHYIDQLKVGESLNVPDVPANLHIIVRTY